MTNPYKEGGTPSPIRALVPTNLALEQSTLERMRQLPHLQRVAGLVVFFLEAKGRLYEQTADKLSEAIQTESETLRREGIVTVQPAGEALDYTRLPQPTQELLFRFLSLGVENVDGPTESIMERLEETGNPFGFEPDVTRSILDMANYFFQEESNNTSIRSPELSPDYTEYFEIIMMLMYECGQPDWPDPYLFDIPGGLHYSHIFPPEAAAQMQAYLDAIHRKAQEPPKDSTPEK